MISIYPEFSKLDLSHKDHVADITSRFEPYSDFNFTSLFSWNVDGLTEVSIFNENLVIKLSDYLDKHPVYSILGDSNIDESIQVLIDKFGRLELIPEVVVQKIQNKEKFTISEDRNNFDYVYDLAELSEFGGSKYKKKRNKSNGFKRAHQNISLEVGSITSIDSGHAVVLQHVDRLWAQQTDRDDGDILADRKALDHLLENSSDFNLLVTEITTDDGIKAFSINEIIGNGYAICHFEKALRVYHEDLNTFIVAEAAKKLRDAGCSWVNWEQDLGLEGLRRSKLSFHPTKMLKKYTIRPI